MFGNDSQTGCIPVKTVRASKDKRLSLLLIIVHQRIGKGVPVIIQRRMHRHSCRLVDDDDVFVLIHDTERQIHRRDIGRALVLTDMDNESVVGVDGSAQVGPHAVYKDAFRHLLKLCEVLV